MKQKSRELLKELKTDKRRALCAAIFGVLSALALSIGFSMDRCGFLTLSAPHVLGFALGTIVLSLAAFMLFGFLDQRPQRETYENKSVYALGIKKAAPVFLLLIVFYVIVLLAVYPGFFVYDAYEELNMFRTGEFTTHHPLTHVLLTGGVISAVQSVTGSWNAGIFVYSLLQTCVITAIFVYLLYSLREMGTSRMIRNLSVFYLALFPTVVMFVLCTCKDGIFAASLLMMVLELLLLFREPEKFWRTAKHPVLYIAFTALLMLYRHNGLYMYIVFLPFFLLFGKREEGKKRQLFLRKAALYAVPLVLALTLSSALQAATGASGGEHQETLTVPIQQLSRTYCYEPESFTGEEKELLFRYLPENYIAHYNPKLSDPVKIGFQNSAYEQDRASFIRLWLTKGLQHPLSYLNAWFSTCFGDFYPWTVIDCYKGSSVFTIIYEDSAYFGFETELPGTRQSFIPLLEKIYRHFSLDAKVQKIPVFRFFYAPGGMALLFLFVFCYAAATERRSVAAALVPVFLTYLTVLLGPCSLPRYVCYFWFLAPFFAAVLFDGGALKEE